jgi:hypothetical protein
MGEWMAAQLRGEVFNVAIHAIFAPPNGTFNSSNFGTISTTTIDICEMQIAARIVF